jgi:hypothetical protein
MAEQLRVGDRVMVLLDSDYWESRGWFEGVVIRIEPYSPHRSFYWVEFAEEIQDRLGSGVRLISVLNPKNIKKL